MWIEIDEELFPPRKSLVGLQFADASDFERAKALVNHGLEMYQETYPGWQMIVVRRTDVPRFSALGLQFTEIDQIDDDELTPEERCRRDRGLIDYWAPILRERLRRRQ
jgi:hypothetical protein